MLFRHLGIKKKIKQLKVLWMIASGYVVHFNSSIFKKRLLTYGSQEARISHPLLQNDTERWTWQPDSELTLDNSCLSDSHGLGQWPPTLLRLMRVAGRIWRNDGVSLLRLVPKWHCLVSLGSLTLRATSHHIMRILKKVMWWRTEASWQ